MKLKDLQIDGLAGRVERWPQIKKKNQTYLSAFSSHWPLLELLHKISCPFFQNAPFLSNLNLFGCQIQIIEKGTIEKLEKLVSCVLLLPGASYT